MLDNVSMSLKTGEIVALLGRSGSGKSTLLRIIAGLNHPTSGTVTISGKPVDRSGRGVAMVFQSFALFPWLNVLDNVEIGPRANGVPLEETRQRALKAIDTIGLDGFESAYPKELSGGMRQRVGFARALVMQPKILLMDEPFSALDVLTAETLRTDLLDLWQEGRIPIKSILMVTHNIEEAVLMSDRILVLSSNPGRIASEIPNTIPHPRDRLDPPFRAMVDSIYALMTQRAETARVAQPAAAGPRPPPARHLDQLARRHARRDRRAALQRQGGPAPSGGLARLRDRRPLPSRRNAADPQARRLRRGRHQAHRRSGSVSSIWTSTSARRLLGEQVLANVPLASHIKRVLDERPSHRAPASRFREELEDYMSEDYAERTLRTVINLGRYGELFAYDEAAQTFSYENPE